jgi:hypothetical protein
VGPARAELLTLVFAAVCMCAGGCGSSSATRESVGLGTGEGATTTRTVASTRDQIYADHDGDDVAGASSSDGDNDDSHERKDRDGDLDNKSGSYYDMDDGSVRYIGHAAGSADRRAVVNLLRRYFKVAVAGDGERACSMVLSSIAKAAPTDLGGPSGPSYARGKTCAVVASKIFTQWHRDLAAHLATLKVSDVRVNGSQGMVVLSFKGLPGQQVPVVREGDRWKMSNFMYSELP